MNYEQQQQQQQQYLAQQQRLAQQQGQQRMPMPLPPQQGMPMQRQPPHNVHMGGQYGMQPGPTQQPNMQQRIMMQQQGQPMPMYQQQQQPQGMQPQGMQHHDQGEQGFQQHPGYQQPSREALMQQRANFNVAYQQLPEEDRMQIQREQDPERRKMLLQMALGRRQQMMNASGAPPTSANQMQMTMVQHRMAAAHQNAQQQHHGSPMMYGQQQMNMGGNQVQGGPIMQGNMSGAPIHIQRIPSQGTFVSGPDTSVVNQQSGVMNNVQNMGSQPGIQPPMQGNQQMYDGPGGAQPMSQFPNQSQPTPQQMSNQASYMQQQHMQNFQQQPQQQFGQPQSQPGSMHQPASNQSSIGHPPSQQQPMSVGPHSHHSQQGSSPMPQQQVGPQSQPASTGPQSVQQPRSHQQSHPPAGYMGSPAVQSGQAPSTGPQSVGGPGSVRPNTPGSRPIPSVPPQSVPPPSIDQNAPEYKEALERLKNYHEPVKRLYSRLKIDDVTGTVNKTLVTSLERVIEIMEGQRVVDIHLIEKLINNVKKALQTHNPAKHLFEIAKKAYNLQQGTDVINPVRNILPDPWHNVRHLQIRVPDHIRELIKNTEEENLENDNSNAKNDRKRKSDEDAKDVTPEKKERNLLATLAASFSNTTTSTTASVKAENDTEEVEQIIQPVKVECFNGNWIKLNNKTSKELNQLPLPFKFDPDFKPISDSCSHVQLMITSNKTQTLINSNAPVLRLLLPVDYPESPLQLYNGHSSARFEENELLEQFKLKLDLSVNLHSISDVINAWAELLDESNGMQKSRPLNGFGFDKDGQSFQSIVIR